MAARLAERVRDGEVLGVGSGSTAFLALQAIGRRLRSDLTGLSAIPTSFEVSLACASLGIPTTSLLQTRPDWCFDGADEVDPAGNLIKGRGGALFLEKLVLSCSPRAVILVDRSKLVDRLGCRFPVPVEVHPLALRAVAERLLGLGATEAVLRPAQGGKDGPVVTEHGNLLLDARFPDIGPGLEHAIKAIPGVIESGLFWGYDVEVLVAEDPARAPSLSRNP